MIEVVKNIPDIHDLALDSKLEAGGFEEIDITRLTKCARIATQQVVAGPVGPGLRAEDVSRHDLTPACYGTPYLDCEVDQPLSQSDYVLLRHKGAETLVPTRIFPVNLENDATTEGGLVYVSFFRAYKKRRSGLTGWLRG